MKQEPASPDLEDLTALSPPDDSSWKEQRMSPRSSSASFPPSPAESDAEATLHGQQKEVVAFAQPYSMHLPNLDPQSPSPSSSSGLLAYTDPRDFSSAGSYGFDLPVLAQGFRQESLENGMGHIQLSPQAGPWHGPSSQLTVRNRLRHRSVPYIATMPRRGMSQPPTQMQTNFSSVPAYLPEIASRSAYTPHNLVHPRSSGHPRVPPLCPSSQMPRTSIIQPRNAVVVQSAACTIGCIDCQLTLREVEGIPHQDDLIIRILEAIHALKPPWGVLTVGFAFFKFLFTFEIWPRNFAYRSELDQVIFAIVHVLAEVPGGFNTATLRRQLEESLPLKDWEPIFATFKPAMFECPFAKQGCCTWEIHKDGLKNYYPFTPFTHVIQM